MSDGVLIYAGSGFNQVVEVSTTDTLLLNVNGVVKKAATSQMPVTAAQQAIVTSVDDRVTSVDAYFKNQVSVLGDRVTSVKSDLTNQTSVFNAAFTSVENRINGVSAAIRTKLVSLADTSLAVSVGAGGLVVQYDSAQQKFVLASVGGGGGGDIASVNNRVTSVDSYFLNQVSVINAAIVSTNNVVSNASSVNNAALVSIESRINGVSVLVNAVSADLTSVKNVVSNNTSVNNAAHVSLESRINAVSVLVAAVSADLTSVKNVVSNTTSVNNAAHTSLQAQINVVSNAASAADARVTSVDIYFKNQISVVDARVTSVATTNFSGYYESSQTSITTGVTVEFTHSLGTVPKLVHVTGLFVSAQGTYRANEYFDIYGYNAGAVNPTNAWVKWDATKVYVMITANGILENGTAALDRNVRMIAKAWK